MLVEKTRIFNLIVHVKDGADIKQFSMGPFDTSKKETIADLMKNGAYTKPSLLAPELYYPPHMIVKMEIKYGWKEGDTTWND